MTPRISLTDWQTRVLLLDIEGTTTPIAFVHEVLFPFARARLLDFIETHRASAEMAGIARGLVAEHAADVARGEHLPAISLEPAALAAYAVWLMERDRKSPGLKQLQGLIWEEGYRAGELRGQVFDDVPGAMARWRRAGLTIAIYSSGSELAQRLLFASTQHGDLTPHIASYFDTAVGAKREAASYTGIAARLSCAPAAVTFVSDVTAELDAARAAGCRTVLSLRPGNPVQPAHSHPAVTTFDYLTDSDATSA